MSIYLASDALVPGFIDEATAAQLTIDTVGDTEIVWERVEEAITAAEAEVDGYLAARLSLPLSEVPPLVVDLAKRVARHKLHSRRPWTVTAELKADYDQAVATLRDISRGLVVLAVPEPAPNPDRIIRRTGKARVFGRTNLEGF